MSPEIPAAPTEPDPIKIEWLPPRPRPWNEAAGYLGYYTRTHLDEKFSLVDCDGAWPALWVYYQVNQRTWRLIEEKPNGQEIHRSQRQAFGALGPAIANHMRCGGFSRYSGIFVIYDAERLVAPEFPIEVQRYQPSRSAKFALTKKQFDRWLLLAESDIDPSSIDHDLFRARHLTLVQR